MATYLERLWSEAQSCGVDRMVFDLTLAPIVLEMEFRHDALQSRLAAAEARAERAVGLLVLCRPLVSTIRVGNVDPQSAHGGDQTAYAIDALLKEVADGR